MRSDNFLQNIFDIYYRAKRYSFLLYLSCIWEGGRIKTRSAWKSSGQALAAWQDLRRANVKTRVTHHRANKRGKTPSKSIRCREGGEERNAERTSRQLWMHYLSAGRLLWLFRKSQQSSTASFAQWLFAIVPASFRRFSRSFRPGYCLCASSGVHGIQVNTTGRHQILYTDYPQ